MIFLKLVILFLFLFTGLYTAPISEPIDPIEICTSNEFSYFKSHPSNLSLYYQCDPWGNGVERSCQLDKIWNKWNLRCESFDNLKNLTLNITLPVVPFNCSLTPCQNGGLCNETKCSCKPDFTGEQCESRLEDLSLQILNGTFNLTSYKRKLIENKLVVNITFYERYKDQLDPDTYSKLMAYLSMYKNENDVRFDALINNLVEQILEDIYPDAEFMTSFNASVQTFGSIIKLIPSLMSYTLYSNDRYEQVFTQYKKVLAGLVNNLFESNQNFTLEAIEYKTLTLYFLSRTNELMTNGSTDLTNKTIDSMQLNEQDVMDNLKVNYNLTVIYTQQLFSMLEQYHLSILNEFGAVNATVYDKTLSEIEWNKKKECLVLFTEIVQSSVQIWDSLLNYGFWFVTNVVSSTRENGIKKV